MVSWIFSIAWSRCCVRGSTRRYERARNRSINPLERRLSVVFPEPPVVGMKAEL